MRKLKCTKYIKHKTKANKVNYTLNKKDVKTIESKTKQG